MTELVTDAEVLKSLEPSYDLLKAVLAFKGMMQGEVLDVARSGPRDAGVRPPAQGEADPLAGVGDPLDGEAPIRLRANPPAGPDPLRADLELRLHQDQRLPAGAEQVGHHRQDQGDRDEGEIAGALLGGALQGLEGLVLLSQLRMEDRELVPDRVA